MQSQEDLTQKLWTVKIIWLAMLGSLGIYLFLGLQFGTALRAVQNADLPLETIKNALAVLALIVVVFLAFMRPFLIKIAFAPQGDHTPPLARYTVIVLITLAIAESVGIFGLVLFMLGVSYHTFYIFLFTSALMMLWHRPKAEEYERMLVNMQNRGEIESP